MSIDPVSLAPLVVLRTGSAQLPARSKPATQAQSSPAADVPHARAVEVNASYGENNIIIYRILDKETGDLIQQIPPEQLLAIARGVRQLLEAETKNSHLDIRS